MARITIEDCKKEIPNRFELVLLAAQRARGINAGDKATVNSEGSVPVIALKEIALGNLDIDKLRDSFIASQQEINIEIEGVATQDFDVPLMGVDIMESEENYDANLDTSGDNIDSIFNDILLEDI